MTLIMSVCVGFVSAVGIERLGIGSQETLAVSGIGTQRRRALSNVESDAVTGLRKVSLYDQRVQRYWFPSSISDNRDLH